MKKLVKKNNKRMSFFNYLKCFLIPQIFPINWILLTTNLILSITCFILILYFISFNYNNKFTNKLEKKNNFNYQW